jgi:hypothetical protein
MDRFKLRGEKLPSLAAIVPLGLQPHAPSPISEVFLVSTTVEPGRVTTYRRTALALAEVGCVL